MIDIYCEIDEKEVKLENLTNSLREKIPNSVIEGLKKKLNSIYCEKHEEYPAVILTDIENENEEMKVRTDLCCCEELSDRAQKKLSGISGIFFGDRTVSFTPYNNSD